MSSASSCSAAHASCPCQTQAEEPSPACVGSAGSRIHLRDPAAHPCSLIRKISGMIYLRRKLEFALEFILEFILDVFLHPNSKPLVACRGIPRHLAWCS